MNDLKMQGKLIECSRNCGQRMLVEEAMVGVNHSAKTIAVCWTCLTPEEQEKARVAYQINAT